MISKRTIIGLIIGIAIIGIGGASLFLHIGTLTINENYTIVIGDSAFYTIPAPINTPQSMTITGAAFDLKLESPADGLQIPNTSYKDKVCVENLCITLFVFQMRNLTPYLFFKVLKQNIVNVTFFQIFSLNNSLQHAHIKYRIIQMREKIRFS